MDNLFWYLGLAIVSMGIAAYSIFTKRNIYKISTLIVFFLFAAGMSWICELIVLGIFNAYTYKTGVFEDIWEQNIFGHLILNTTLYPTLAIFVVTHSKRYISISVSAAILTLIEYLFVHFGVYEQHWWKYYFTIVTVVTLLSIESVWFGKVKNGCIALSRAVTFYFVAIIIIHFPAPILMFFGKQYYQFSIVNNLFKDPYLSSTIIIFTDHLIECFLLVLFTCVLHKWYFKILPFLIPILVQNVFVRENILIIGDHWSLIYTLIIYELFVGLYMITEKYTLNRTSDKSSISCCSKEP